MKVKLVTPVGKFDFDNDNRHLSYYKGQRINDFVPKKSSNTEEVKDAEENKDKE